MEVLIPNTDLFFDPSEDDVADYTLSDEAESVWIGVDNLSIYIRRADEGVAVDIYPKGQEADESIAGTWALFSEGSSDEEE